MKRILCILMILMLAPGFALANDYDSGVMMASTESGSLVKLVTGMGVPGNPELSRGDIVAIRFQSSLFNAPDSAWDMSAAGDRSVLGWTEETPEGLRLVIAALGGVRANEDSSSLFAYYTHLLRIDFDNSFDTSGVTNMNRMFANCHDLRTLDVRQLNTSNVTDMAYMFANCFQLYSLDLRSFDTSRVTDMSGMFHSSYNLASLNLSGLDTKNVEDLHVMFDFCRSLTSLDLTSFDTRRVTDMGGMFLLCDSLREVRVSSNFVKPDSFWKTFDMFVGCGAKELTYVN